MYKYEVGDLIQTSLGDSYLVLGVKEFYRNNAKLSYTKYQIMRLRNEEILWYNARELEKVTYKVA
jgi:hypothetical protein